MGDYIPQAPVNDDAKKHNENLPGQGGVFNTVNLQVYHYAGNNPVKYVDPKGKWTFGIYQTKSLGAEYGATVGGGYSFSVSGDKAVKSGTTTAVTTGGSGGEVFTVGGDI